MANNEERPRDDPFEENARQNLKALLARQRALPAAHRKTATALAERLGKEKNWATGVIQGKYAVRLTHLGAIGRFFEIDPLALLTPDLSRQTPLVPSPSNQGGADGEAQADLLERDTLRRATIRKAQEAVRAAADILDTLADDETPRPRTGETRRDAPGRKHRRRPA